VLSKQLSEKIIIGLYSEIPEFEKYITGLEEDVITDYLIMDYLGDFLKDLINKSTSLELIDRCYSYINELCEEKNEEIEQWLKETFLESIIDKGKPRELSKLKLKSKALALYEEILAHSFFGGTQP